MAWTVTAYSQIDGSVRETHYFNYEVEAKVAKVKLDDKYRDDLCNVKIEEV
ncbi:hypothetical protein [Streptococcus sp. S784/96/1]|uniref:hypothetical protein n=1 Tax=Streptococcus sp. S784/96/1 TaxID=2653499 RepID=UPI00138703A7|nr:hypothetical protein [Streptococcus sp. S784/96/1]